MKKITTAPVTALILLLSLVTVSFYRCKPSTESDQDTLAYKEVQIVFPDTSNTPIQSDSLAALLSGNYAAKYWGKIFKSCIQSDLVKKKDADYLGPTNTIGLGAITDSERESTYWVIDSTVFSSAEIKNMIKPGNPQSCNLELGGTLDLEALLETEFEIEKDPDLAIGLKTEINKKKKITFKVKAWQKDELLLGPLKVALKKSTNSNKAEFKSELNKAGRILMNRVIRIKGFVAEIVLNSDIKADVKAKVGNGVIGKLQDGKADVGVKVVSDKLIRMESDAEFFVFGKFIDPDPIE